MQGILGVTQNRPLFYVDHDASTNRYDIFFGFMRITSIPDIKRSNLFKSAIAMFVNAGIRNRDIQENFNLSYTTVKKISDCFNECTCDEELMERLKNPGRIPKITLEIRRSIYERTEFHKSCGEYHYIKKTIADIQEEYGVKLSREAIRLELKKKNLNSESDARGMHEKNIVRNSPETEIFSDAGGRRTETGENEIRRNNYAGMQLLGSWLSPALSDFPSLSTEISGHSMKAILLWWMVGILLGAKNFERQRYLHLDDFERLTGLPDMPSVETMRSILRQFQLTQGEFER